MKRILWGLITIASLTTVMVYGIPKKSRMRPECGASGPCLEKREVPCCNELPRNLKILLTNDQGNTLSFQTLRKALIDANHEVKSFIPTGPVSSLSTAFTKQVLNRSLVPGFLDIWIVDSAVIFDKTGGNTFPATPVECVEIGLLQFFGDFDLILSGFNDDIFSAGSLTPISGGIGAAIAGSIQSQGVQIVLPNIPSIAVSIANESPNFEASEARIEQAAQFVVSLLRRLDECRETVDFVERLLPPFTGLSINIPGRKSDDSGDLPIAGVTIDRVGRRASRSKEKELLLEAVQDPQDSDKYTVKAVETALNPLNKDIPFSDNEDRSDRFITIVPFQADFTAPTGIVQKLCRKLRCEVLTPRACEEDFCENLRCLDLFVHEKCCPKKTCSEKGCPKKKDHK